MLLVSYLAGGTVEVIFAIVRKEEINEGFLVTGLLFGAFFMATDPVTSPVSNFGKWIYGGLIGFMTILIRNFTGYVEGVMFAVLLGNIAAPIIDEIAFKVRLWRLAREA